MPNIKPYKERHTFQDRLAKTKSYAESDPDKVMVIVQKHPKSKLPDLSNSKFLAFKTFQFKQVRNLIAKRLKEVTGNKQQDNKESFFLFVKGKIPSMETTMDELHKSSRDDDGVLYITYQEQPSF